jgi:hypothetical protein
MDGRIAAVHRSQQHLSRKCASGSHPREAESCFAKSPIEEFLDTLFPVYGKIGNHPFIYLYK